MSNSPNITNDKIKTTAEKHTQSVPQIQSINLSTGKYRTTTQPYRSIPRRKQPTITTGVIWPIDESIQSEPF